LVQVWVDNINNTQWSPGGRWRVDELYKEIMRLITEAAERAIPKTKPNNNRSLKKVPYWTTKCTNAIAARTKALATARTQKTLEACIELRKEKAHCQQILKQEKQKSWNDYCDNLTDSTQLSSVWRMSKSMQGINTNTSIPTINENNAIHETNEKKANLFANKFSKISSRKNHLVVTSKIIPSFWSQPG